MAHRSGSFSLEAFSMSTGTTHPLVGFPPASVKIVRSGRSPFRLNTMARPYIRGRYLLDGDKREFYTWDDYLIEDRGRHPKIYDWPTGRDITPVCQDT